MYPSDKIRDNRASNVNRLLINPLPTLTVFLIVLNDPAELSMVTYDFLFKSSVLMLILAPKAAAPLVELPTPL